MFESAEIGHEIGKKVYKQRESVLREALLGLQYQLLKSARFPVIILVNGVDGAGKGETVNLFNEWMDPRHIRTEALGETAEDHYGLPAMWRFWQVLPAKGHIGILFGSWYSEPIVARVMGHEKTARFTQRLESIREFERMLVAEGALLVKFWFHLSKAAARKRFKALEADPRNAWRVTPQDWQRLKHYDAFVKVSEQALRKTSTGEAPWLVIDGSDPAYRALTAGQYLLDALGQRLAGQAAVAAVSAPVAPVAMDQRTLLGSFDYRRSLPLKTYQRRLVELQGRLNLLMRDAAMRKRSLVLVFEGMDAAGKGSTIRRVTQALDARQYHVTPIAAPSEEERAQPYLWRFWRHLPHHGHAALFDRSWYGRVLVERVEGFCSESDWMRAFDEINAFEEQLVDSGAVVIKFWLAITLDEQLRRFNERKATPHKNFKITEDDWRNRDKWPQYERAIGDMIDRTSTELAPWHVVASDDKMFSRIEVLTKLCE
ncbi:MAG: polyphosphate:AMP phosphotransferase, partial [Comamonadaceae bacterium]